MSLRVVVYAEGVGELGTGLALRPAPGDTLQADALGPGHVLARRSIEHVRGVPGPAIRFEEGLRKRNGAEPRGSDFLNPKTLLQLLDWPRDDMRPELALVFVDEDGDKKRHAEIKERVEGLRHGRPPTVIAVARQEFESWLVTDRACVARTLDRHFPDRGDAEGWKPGEAKRLLQETIDKPAGMTDRQRTHQVRREICEHCDLAELRMRSQSFARFLFDLKSQ